MGARYRGKRSPPPPPSLSSSRSGSPQRHRRPSLGPWRIPPPPPQPTPTGHLAGPAAASLPRCLPAAPAASLPAATTSSCSAGAFSSCPARCRHLLLPCCPPALMARPPVPAGTSDGAAIEPPQGLGRRCPPPSLREPPMTPVTSSPLPTHSKVSNHPHISPPLL
ncbi:hypothetical protein BRADI_4g17234v3 [Brachypodium distachyon]|uniref:Uncharacterized protein n=1 Tax=Brachypodium distachyon TaxID=15368 RepID=A0A2K2CNG2_BRADI|nr:hypothetical protein BRADI_4g17234v3 [Brachypodium distachyon]